MKNIQQIKIGFLPFIVYFLITSSFCIGDESLGFINKVSNNFTMMSGELLRIPCVVDSDNMDYECNWLLNSKLKFPSENKYNFKRHSDKGDCSITIFNLSFVQDDGIWDCQVFFKETLISQAVRVTILMPPERPKMIHNDQLVSNGKIKVTANRTEILECIVENGNPAPSLNWVLDNQVLDSKYVTRNSSFNYTKSTLKFNFDKTMNGNRLICDSRHQLANDISAVDLNVIYLPEVRIENKIYTVEQGGELEISCNVQANPPASVKWIDIDNPKILFSDQEVLVLSQIQKEKNNKVYQCNAENEVGRSNDASFKLNVLYEPILVKQSENKRVKLGGKVSFECQVDGNPKPKINWYHFNNLNGQLNMVETASDDLSVLLINNVTYNHEGHYYCEASNRIYQTLKTIRSEEMFLDVYGLPGILNENNVKEGILGGKSNINLEFCSDPSPNLIYWKVGICRLPVDLSTDNSFENLAPKTSSSQGICGRYSLSAIEKLSNQIPFKVDEKQSCYRTILSIENTEEEDEKEYSLVVQNENGLIEYTVKLEVTSPLPLATLIILVLITIFVLIAIGLFFIMILRRKHKGSENMNDDVLKEEAQTISHKGDLDSSVAKIDFNSLNLNPSNDSYELVYANLDFTPREQYDQLNLCQNNQLSLTLQQKQQLLNQKQMSNVKPNQMKIGLPEAKKQPPAIRPKPQLRPQHTPRQTNGSTEYAKLTFNKADI